MYRLAATLSGHDGPVSSVRFSPCGGLLASASGDATVRIWRVPAATLLCVLRGHGSGVNDVAWAPGGGALATAGDDGTVRLWALRAAVGLLAHTCRGHTSHVFCVAFNAKGNMLARPKWSGLRESG